MDSAIHPFAILNYTDVRAGISDPITLGGAGLRFLQQRADLLEAIKAGKESSLDYYLFVQSAYCQYRQGLLTDGASAQKDVPAVDNDSLDDD